MALRALQGPTGGGTPVGGTGTPNTIPRWTGVSTLGDSIITQDVANSRIGINTAAPVRTLHVVATTAASPARLQNTVGSFELGFDASGAYFQPNTANTGVWLYTQAGSFFGISGAAGTQGNVGIGTASPNTRLQVNDGSFPGVSTATQRNIYTGTITAGYGGSIGFGGYYTGTTETTFAFIVGGKDNATAGDYAGHLQFWTRPNGGSYAERARIDSSGNLGLGVTLSAWGSSYRAFQTLGTTLGSNSTNGTYYTQNAFFDGTNWKYVTTAAANRYQMLLGVHSWHTASSGTAGNNITFTQAMTLDASGNVYAGSGTTGMTDGFFYIAAAAGAPTGTPTAVSGRVPMYYDTTNNKFYIYNGAWKQVALT